MALLINNQVLSLRSISPRDITTEYVNWLNDPEIKRYMGIRHKESPFGHTDVFDFLKQCNEAKRFHWGIFVDQKHIGNVSCSAWSHENRWIDISFMIGKKDLHGQGYATLSVGAAMKYLFETQKFNRIQAHAVESNLSSIRVFEKLRMKKEADLRESAFFPSENKFENEVIYSALRREWTPPDERLNHIQVDAMTWQLV